MEKKVLVGPFKPSRETGNNFLFKGGLTVSSVYPPDAVYEGLLFLGDDDRSLHQVTMGRGEGRRGHLRAQLLVFAHERLA